MHRSFRHAGFSPRFSTCIHGNIRAKTTLSVTDSSSKLITDAGRKTKSSDNILTKNNIFLIEPAQMIPRHIILGRTMCNPRRHVCCTRHCHQTHAFSGLSLVLLSLRNIRSFFKRLLQPPWVSLPTQQQTSRSGLEFQKIARNIRRWMPGETVRRENESPNPTAREAYSHPAPPATSTVFVELDAILAAGESV